MGRRNLIRAAAVITVLAGVLSAIYVFKVLRPIWAVERSVKLLLKDPESALFSDVAFAPNGVVACGYVNAKNSMGGYVGRKHFMTIGDYASIDPDFDVDTSKDAEYQRDMKKIHDDYIASIYARCAGVS